MRKLALITLAIILLSSGMGMAKEVGDYKLTVDDQLYISVWGQPDLQQEVVVGPDGKISFPLIGQVPAEDKTIAELTKLITDKLQQYIEVKESQVNVVFREYEKIKVMILGEIKQPGAYQVGPQKEVLDLLSLAGGTTKTANLEEAQLRRDDQSLPVDLKALLAGKKQKQNYTLQEGDVLYIPEEAIEVSILGAVNQPGKYQLKHGARLSDLLARAGDVTDEAADKLKYISGDQVQKLDLDKLLASEETKNPVLQDGDTVQILESNYDLGKISFWRNFFFFVGGLNQLDDLVN
ncbi:polysaccharide biosynthesis/export family protein [Halanaerobaculum tunisiense]